MPSTPDLHATVLSAWQTNNRVTSYLIENIPSDLWAAAIPGVPQRTIRMIAAHLHNARCRWIRTLGSEHGIPAPGRVDHWTVSRRQLVAALKHSSRGMLALLRLTLAEGGTLPPSRATSGGICRWTSDMC